MISKCANPACTAHFLYLHEGKLFRVLRGTDEPPAQEMGVDPTAPKRAQRVEFFWLCRECSTQMTLRFDKNLGIVVYPLVMAVRAAS